MNATEALQQARLYTDGVDYLLVHLPANAITRAAGILAEIGDPFGAMIVDKDEVTLVIPAEMQPVFATRLTDAEFSTPYRLLTFDLVLPSDLIGFMALVAKILAIVEISIIPLGAYARDHILIPSPLFDKALEALRSAQVNSK